MAPVKGHNRQRDFERLAQATTADLDPEEDVAPDGSDDASDSERDEDEFDGREHYVDVGKSKLREAKTVPLGPQYLGSRVGREEIETEDEDDPFSRGFDDGSSEEEVQGADASDMEGEEGEDEGTDDTDLSEDEGEGTDVLARPRLQDLAMMKQAKQAKDAEARQSVAKSLSAANREEAEKGRAIKRQRNTFDSLLNTRMKLQKSLISTNTLVGTPAEDIEAAREDAQRFIQGAEQAAFNLWSSLNAFREDLLAARTGTKRKRTAFSIETSSDDLWEHMQSQEREIKATRDLVLKKWSTKAQGPSVQSQARLNQSAQQTTIIDILQEQLSNTDRLVAKAHAPRSCAPLQASQRAISDPKIYDDADFYGLLLKELLEQKSADSVAASTIDLGFQMRRETKTKRNVDTKASKGRKLRYTVHEKLQNFMAPEDRTRWGDRQADELFGSLFGQRLGLGEREDENMDDQEVNGTDADEAGLLMFGS